MGKINLGDRDVYEGEKGTIKTESKTEVRGDREGARGETKRRTGTTCGESTYDLCKDKGETPEGGRDR